jgi:hypothetical protein
MECGGKRLGISPPWGILYVQVQYCDLHRTTTAYAPTVHSASMSPSYTLIPPLLEEVCFTLMASENGAMITGGKSEESKEPYVRLARSSGVLFVCASISFLHSSGDKEALVKARGKLKLRTPNLCYSPVSRQHDIIYHGMILLANVRSASGTEVSTLNLTV